MNTRSRGFTLVELMIVVAIIGVLAAIAIPAFRRYIKSTRVAEAESIMQKITQGGAAYFTSEQKYSDGATGDQPWHPGTAVQSMPNTSGMPVEFPRKTFPGGLDYLFNTIDGPGTYIDCGSAPDGGVKYQYSVPADPLLTATLNKIKLSFEDPMYFQYAYASVGEGLGAESRVAATVDWNPGGPCHQFEQIITIDNTSQDVQIGPRAVTHEFE